MIEDVNLSQGFYDGLSINHNVLNVSYSRCPFYFFACVPSNIQRAADTLRNEFLMQDYFKLHHKQLFACFNLGLSWRNPLWFSENCLSQVFTSSALFLLGQKASFLPDKQDAAFWFHRHVRKVVTPSDRCRLNHQSVKFSQECGLKVQQIRTFVFKSRLPFQICFCTFFKINPRRWNVNVQVDPKEAPQRKKLLTKVKVLTGSQVERCIFSIRDSHSGNTNAERLHINTESVQSSADSRRLGHGAGEFSSFIHRHHLPFCFQFLYSWAENVGCLFLPLCSGVQVFRALLVLGLATLLHATRGGHVVSVRLARGTELKGRTVRLHLDPSVQTHIGSTSTSDIANMSLTPWTYRWGCYSSLYTVCVK